MRKGLFLVVILAALLIFSTASPIWAMEEKSASPPAVERWNPILGSEDRVILNDEYQSGLVRHYYIDPNCSQGVGYVLWVFYKDGSKELLVKKWMLGTEQEQEAMKLPDGTWYIRLPSKGRPPQLSLKILRVALEKSDEKFINGKLLLKDFFQVLIDEKGKMLAHRIIYLNKKSANDPDPVPAQK